ERKEKNVQKGLDNSGNIEGNSNGIFATVFAGVHLWSPHSLDAAARSALALAGAKRQSGGGRARSPSPPRLPVGPRGGPGAVPPQLSVLPRPVPRWRSAPLSRPCGPRGDGSLRSPDGRAVHGQPQPVTGSRVALTIAPLARTPSTATRRTCGPGASGAT